MSCRGQRLAPRDPACSPESTSNRSAQGANFAADLRDALDAASSMTSTQAQAWSSQPRRRMDKDLIDRQPQQAGLETPSADTLHGSRHALAACIRRSAACRNGANHWLAWRARSSSPAKLLLLGWYTPALNANESGPHSVPCSSASRPVPAWRQITGNPGPIEQRSQLASRKRWGCRCFCLCHALHHFR